jgi:hypothetical protein
MTRRKDNEPRRSGKDNSSRWEHEQRSIDLAWINTYLSDFADIAREQYKVYGRGLILVDISIIVFPLLANPVLYIPQHEIEKLEGMLDLKQMVRDYTPTQEMIIVILKMGGMREGIYRVLMPPSFPNLN